MAYHICTSTRVEGDHVVLGGRGKGASAVVPRRVFEGLPQTGSCLDAGGISWLITQGGKPSNYRTMITPLLGATLGVNDVWLSLPDFISMSVKMVKDHPKADEYEVSWSAELRRAT